MEMKSFLYIVIYVTCRSFLAGLRRCQIMRLGICAEKIPTVMRRQPKISRPVMVSPKKRYPARAEKIISKLSSREASVGGTYCWPMICRV